MKFNAFLLLLTLNSCFLFPDKTDSHKDIERFYSENNLKTGAGKTFISNIDIISTNSTQIKAFIQGHYSNKSLAKPESREFNDTIVFQYLKNEKPKKLKIVYTYN